MELDKKIKQLRLKAGLTQEQLAEKLGIGPQAVSKWENRAAMPDITMLPLLAETFGVSIDDLFDLTTEQRLNRIENRLDIEEDLPQDIFMEFEEFLKTRLASEQYKNRAADLIAYLYWHRMNAYAQKVRRYAKDAIRLDPGKKGCQWMLNYAEGHAIWDWNLANHSAAVEFYRELTESSPECRLPYLYLLDNLITDHRTDEAEEVLSRLSRLKDADPIHEQVYRAHIALARFNEPEADRIIEKLLAEHPDNYVSLFEAAQYYSKKCCYLKAIGLYEEAFSKSPRRPRYIDELQSITEIYKIMGETQKAADTCDRIISLLQTEWGMTEEIELKNAQKEKNELLAKLQIPL